MSRKFYRNINGYISAAVIITLQILLSGSCIRSKGEVHGDTLLNEIISNRNFIRKAYSESGKAEPVFITVWDFDGTIIKGDCSEGFAENGRTVYTGLAEKMINSGYSGKYKPGGYADFFKKYNYLDKTEGHLVSYSYLTEIFSGADEAEVKNASADHFNKVLKQFYFKTSFMMIKELISSGIEIYVISASPDFFVKGASKSLGVPEKNITGIRLETLHGKLSSKITAPVTFDTGKTILLKKIMNEIKEKTGRDAVVLAGLGNSYATDGDFLRYVTECRYHRVSGTAVMINGGTEPEKFRGLFRKVIQNDIIGRHDSNSNKTYRSTGEIQEPD